MLKAVDTTSNASSSTPSDSTDSKTRSEPTSRVSSTATNGSATDAPNERIREDELQALRDREPDAVERWIYGHRDLIFHFLLKRVKDEDTAQELLQETFFQALRSIPSFRGDSKVSTWLCSIARNLAYKHFRDQDRYTTAESETLEYINHVGEEQSTTHSSFDGNPRSHTERSQRKQMIHAAMDELPDSYRQIIRLRDLEEQSTEEVADELDLTRVNVRVRLHRARKRLKSLLDPQLTADYRLAA
jgi:RNA polymerase sigma-70 factor (ECF subfamily)